MLRALRILIVLAAGVALALWLAKVGGVVEIRVGEYGIGTPMPIALLILALGFLVLHGILSFIGAMRRLPGRVRVRHPPARRTHSRKPQENHSLCGSPSNFPALPNSGDVALPLRSPSGDMDPTFYFPVTRSISPLASRRPLGHQAAAGEFSSDAPPRAPWPPPSNMACHMDTRARSDLVAH